ncbi:MAG TPA: hypothetical protein VD906_04095 [Caulobacteraceae bacterium]|nr:hypothetical protein [Caulobacteraceae bacterium]
MAKQEQDGWLRLESRFRKIGWTIGGLLLLAPLVAMQFTEEVKWTAGDFVFMGLLIGGTGGLYELAARTTSGLAYRFAAGAALGAGFLLIWLSGAVGIIGSENEPLNQLYFLVLAIAAVGGFVVDFKPRRMAWVMTTAAAAQMGVAVIALFHGYFTLPLNGIFAAIWMLSAWLFRKAAEGESAS